MTDLLTPPPAAEARSRSRPRRSRRRGQRHSAYEIILIGIVAYAVVALLNARGLHERATDSELGARRDVLVALTGAIVRTSELTGLARPGALVDDLRDRERAGEAEVVPLPSLPPTVAPDREPAPPAPATTTAPTTTAVPVALAPPEARAASGAPRPDGTVAPPATPAVPTADATAAADAPAVDAAPAIDAAAAVAVSSPDPAVVEAAPTTTVPAPLTVRTPTPEAPLRVYVGGDSLAVGLGWSFARLGAATGLVDAIEGARISSGLSRPDYYDWPAQIQRVVAEDDPEVIVVMFGANDAQAVQTEAGRLAFGTPEWEAEYRARVEAIMALASQDRRLVWVGEPVVRDGDLDAKMQVIDRIQREAASAFPHVTFVDGRTLFASPEGTYTDRLPSGDAVVRGGDGVHPNATGYDRLAALAAQEILRLTDPAQAALPAPAVAPGEQPPPL